MSDTPTSDQIVADFTLAFGGLIRRLRSQVHATDLNLSETSVVARLERDGAMTTAALARAEVMKPQSMGTLLAHLERAGMVRRRPHPTDGRQILFALTPVGLEARHRQMAAKRAWLVAALARLDADEVQVLHAALPLIRRLGEP